MDILFENGLQLVIHSRPEFHTSYIEFVIGCGSMNEPEGKEGLTHFLEHLLFKDSKNFKAKERGNLYYKNAAMVNAYTSFDAIVLHAEVGNANLDNIIEPLIEQIFYPKFTKEEFETEKGVIIQELLSYEAIPDYALFKKMNERMYKGCNISKGIGGTVESVQKLTYEDLVEYLEKIIHPANVQVILVGDLKSVTCRDLKVYQILSQIKGNGEFIKDDTQYNLALNTNFIHNGPKFNVFSHPSSQTVKYIVLFKGEARCEEKVKTNRILTQLARYFGNPLNSILFNKMREEKGLCYHIECKYEQENYAGFFTILGECSIELFNENMKTIVECINELRKGLSEENVKDLTDRYLASSPFFDNSASKEGERISNRVFSGMGIVSLESINEDMKKLTKEDYNHIIDKYVVPENCIFMALGNEEMESKIKEVFDKLPQ